ncbi:Fc.00g015000.m01.CDS01 [Cosmosporella sp. VM-42]
MTGMKTPAKVAQTPAKARRSSSRVLKNETTSSVVSTPSSGYTHHLPTEKDRKKNGRVAGRNLIIWGRPRMAEKLLLHIQYECQRAKIDLPWNAIAHRLKPGSSGAAINQHMSRLRRELIAEGHVVPPPTQKGGHIDSDIRGYVRMDMDGEDKESVRPVKYSESVEDRRFNLPDAYDLEVSPTSAGTFTDVEDAEESYPETPTPVRHFPRVPVSGRPMTKPTFPLQSPGELDFTKYQMNTAQHFGLRAGVVVNDDCDLEQEFITPTTPHTPVHLRAGRNGFANPYYSGGRFCSPESNVAAYFNTPSTPLSTMSSDLKTTSFDTQAGTGWQIGASQITPPQSIQKPGNYENLETPSSGLFSMEEEFDLSAFCDVDEDNMNFTTPDGSSF